SSCWRNVYEGQYRQLANGQNMALLLALILALAACSGNKQKDGQSKDPSPQMSTQQSNSSGGAQGSDEIDPLGKYDPPIEVTTVRNLSDVVENNVLGVLKGET